MIRHTRMTRCDMKRATEILGKTEGAIRKGIERKQIPYRRLGRRIFFFEEELYGLFESAPGVPLSEIAKERSA